MTNTTDPDRWDFVPSSMAVITADPDPRTGTQHFPYDRPGVSNIDATVWANYETILDDNGGVDILESDIGHFDPVDQPIGSFVLVQTDVSGHKWITTWTDLADIEHHLDVSDDDSWSITQIEDLRNGQHYRVEVAHRIHELDT